MADEDILSGDFSFSPPPSGTIEFSVNGVKFQARSWIPGDHLVDVSATMLQLRGRSVNDIPLSALVSRDFMRIAMVVDCPHCAGSGSVPGPENPEEGITDTGIDCSECSGTGTDASEYVRFTDFVRDPKQGVDIKGLGQIVGYLMGKYAVFPTA